MFTEGFPTNELEFHDRFNSEEACREYFSAVRWPDGFICPHCGHTEGWRRSNRDEWICAGRACGKETSLRAGTVLHNSPKPLRAWLLAMLHMTVNKQSISALRLQKLMGFGSYKTALRWLRELRRAMATVVETHKLGPEVEADEAEFVGIRVGGKKGFGSNKPQVVCVVEKRGEGCGQARMKWIPKHDDEAIRQFVIEVTNPGSLVSTDGEHAYSRLNEHGLFVDARPVTVTKEKKNRGNAKKLDDGKKVVEIHLPRIHRVISLSKRVLISAHQGRCGSKHIQEYLDEYCFRFNRRMDSRPLALLQRLTVAMIRVKAVPLWKSSGRTDPKSPTFPYERPWLHYGAEAA